MRRLLALVAAVAMIAGAVLVRRALDDDSSASDSASSSTDNTDAGELVVVCATEAAAACTPLRDAGATTRIEPAGRTAARLRDSTLEPDDLDFDVWLTPQPWPAMVADSRGRALAAPVLDEPSDVIARTPAVLVARSSRGEALTSTCGAVSWGCLGDAAGQPWSQHGGEASWGEVRPGHEPPTESTAGLLAVAQATADRLGTSDYASNDLDASFRSWFGGLEAAIRDHTPPAGTPLDQMLLTPAAYDVVGSLEATAGPAVAASRDRDRLDIVVADPIVTADLVAVAPAGSAGDALAVAQDPTVAEALLAAGWRVGSAVPETADPNTPLPDTDGLPQPGVLIALTDLWIEVT